MDNTLKGLIYNKESENVQQDKGSNYLVLLDKVRDFLSQNYAEQLSISITQDDNEVPVKNLIKGFIEEKGEYVEEYTVNELVEKIYSDMIGFSFLEDYIKNHEVEEILVNSFDSIEVITNIGRKKVSDMFSTPAVSLNMFKKMARLSGDYLDNKSPITESYIANGIRVSAIIPPVVDKEAGISSTIRKQKIAKVSKQNLIESNTATDEMLDFIVFCVEHGISMGFAGRTSSGKTTDISYILNSIDTKKRIFSIEETREIDFSGHTSVVATRTRRSDNPEMNISMNDLLRTALRFTPDIICVAEMRGEEAMASQEASRTGHTVVTTLHAISARSAYHRILSMCQMSNTRIPTNYIMQFIIEAFPIVVYKRRLADGSRKIIEIVEAVGFENENVKAKTLYSFNIRENKFEKKDNISDSLIQIMLENGAEQKDIDRFIGR